MRNRLIMHMQLAAALGTAAVLASPTVESAAEAMELPPPRPRKLNKAEKKAAKRARRAALNNPPKSE